MKLTTLGMQFLCVDSIAVTPPLGTHLWQHWDGEQHAMRHNHSRIVIHETNENHWRQLVELRDTHLSQTQLNNQQGIMTETIEDKETSLHQACLNQ